MSAITFSIDATTAEIIAHHYRGTSMSFGRNVTLSQIVEGMKKREAGALIQDAMPFLDVDQREFIISGLTPEMWEECFGAPKMYFL